MSEPVVMWAVYQARSKYPWAVGRTKKAVMDEAWSTCGLCERTPGYRVVKVRVEEIEEP